MVVIRLFDRTVRTTPCCCVTSCRGFGLDAYKCVEKKGRGGGGAGHGVPHAWVMTQSAAGVVTFWERLNGHRCDGDGEKCLKEGFKWDEGRGKGEIGGRRGRK